MLQYGIVDVLLSFVPVLVFLASLNALDTYRLLTASRIVTAVVAGVVAAAISYPLNTIGFSKWGDSHSFYTGPMIEELAKACYVVGCIAFHRVGFPVDAAVTGFAVGAGFSLAENLVYLYQIPSSPPLVWLVRGLGTATMHGGATAIVGLVAVTLAVRWRWWLAVFPALASGMAVHVLYNSGALPPLERTAVILVTLPMVLMFAFRQSEQMLSKWLHCKMDSDLETLNMIESGKFLESPAGIYLASLRDLFKPEVVMDMFCFLRLSAELSAKAKAELMQREMGFTPALDPERSAIIKEMAHLETVIGKAGRSALSPLIPSGSSEQWEKMRLNDN